MNSYTILAKYYDRLMGDFNYDGYVAFAKKFLHGEGVDLCSGSGKIAIALAELDCKMIGVDLSAEMLNNAVVASKQRGLNILWINSDVVEFVPPHKVDFVSCVCDGFNYLTKKQLETTLDNVYDYVKPGGYLIFDISSQYKLSHILGDEMFCEDYDDLTYIWSNKFNKDEQKLEMQISFFENIDGDKYLRIDEEHIQYAHSNEFIQSELGKKWSVQCFDGESFKSPSTKSRRLLYVCQKQSIK